MRSWLWVVLGVSGCADPGLGVLGGKDGDISGSLLQVGERSDGLHNVQDLDFNPAVSGELWTVNRRDDSVAIFDVTDPQNPTSEHIIDPYALHFMEQVSSISFGEHGTFATCQDSRNTYNDAAEGNDFMGPTLWSSEMDVFGQSNPNAVSYLTDLFGGPVDLGSHLDMLHESPECMGIEWDHDNVYWVYDGFHGSINRYDFQVDHGPGFDNHCDGDIQRWTGLELSRVEGVVSHLTLDRQHGILYIADTGNNRVLALDTSSGSRGRSLASVEDGSCQQTYGISGPAHYVWRGSDVTVVASNLEHPSGIHLVDGLLFVAENGTGRIHAFDVSEATEIDDVVGLEAVGVAETGIPAGGIQGINLPSAEELWIVDNDGRALWLMDATKQ